jgi:hypothetical protein
MTIPLLCPTCGTTVGVCEASFPPRTQGYDLPDEFPCPGEENHRPLTVTNRSELFGLINRVTANYPETKTSSSVREYVGPKWRPLVWLAIVLGDNNRVLINGKHCYWNFGYGLYGDGALELRST